MLKKKLFEESLTEHFKKQPLDEVQREGIQRCLQSCRYSRLKYSVAETKLIENQYQSVGADKARALSPTSIISEDTVFDEPDLNKALENLESNAIKSCEKLSFDKE